MTRSRLLAVLLLAVSQPALAAADANCKPVVDSDKGRAAAKAWHNKKSMNGMSMEMIRLDDDIYSNVANGGWKKMPAGMVKSITSAAESSSGFNVTECKKLGEESVGGIATTIYSFKTAIPGQPPFAGKVWVGNKDGLPYREAGDTYEGTTTYKGVSAPATK